MILAPVEATRDYLRYESDNDSLILDALQDASAAVLRYLKSTDALVLDSEENIVTDSEGVAEDVPGPIRRATMILAGVLLRDPSGVEMSKWRQGYLPDPVMSLLYSYRDPELR